MVYTSNHSPWACREHKNEVIEVAGEIGVKMVVGGYGPDDFKTMEAIEKTAVEVNYLNEQLPDLAGKLSVNISWSRRNSFRV